jgi:hypothetical protein
VLADVASPEPVMVLSLSAVFQAEAALSDALPRDTAYPTLQARTYPGVEMTSSCPIQVSWSRSSSGQITASCQCSPANALIDSTLSYPTGLLRRLADVLSQHRRMPVPGDGSSIDAARALVDAAQTRPSSRFWSTMPTTVALLHPRLSYCAIATGGH